MGLERRFKRPGLEPATAQWLAMTTEKADDGGVQFSYDLDAVSALYDGPLPYGPLA